MGGKSIMKKNLFKTLAAFVCFFTLSFGAASVTQIQAKPNSVKTIATTFQPQDLPPFW